MATITNPHDKLFRETWSRKAEVQSFLTHYLPPEIRDALDLATLEICKDSFVAEHLKDWFSDMLYKVKVQEASVYLYLLFEHKSAPERLIHLQLLEYMVQIWRLHLKQGESGKLPIILPIVIAHGRDPWRYGLKLSDLLEGPKDLLKAHIPDFAFILRDFSGYSDAEITGTILLRVVLWLLKHIFDENLSDRVPELFQLLQELAAQEQGTRAIEMVFRYICSVTDRVSIEMLVNKAQETLTPEAREAVMTIAQQLENKGYDRGFEKGMQQGQQGIQQAKQQGIVEGLWQAIELGLQLKFGLEGIKLMPGVYAIHDLARLLTIKKAIPLAQNVAEIQALLPETS